MTMDLRRGQAALRVVIATAIWMMLALPTAQSQTSPPSGRPAASIAPATQTDINSFLSTFDKKAASRAGDSAAQPAPTEVAPASGTDDRPARITDEASPFRTLFLMLGGVVVCALATVGLTLTFFALRKDISRRRRGRRRPSSGNPGAHAAHR